MRIGPGLASGDLRILEAMTDTMAHRGPNDRGTWSEGPVGFGHRRLSVIDLSAAGRQPMANEDGAVVMTYNGEVYNFRELKAKHRLEEKGHVFKSLTDSEVIIHLFEELGPAIAAELSGMFALAIWDRRTETLHLMRDRYGIKPLFYQKDGAHFRFGSEIKAIIADARVPRRPSLQALHDFLTLNYVPDQQTAFEGIYEVPPGHVMSVARDGTTKLTRYWDLDFTASDAITEDEAVAESFRLMDESLARHLIADVPVGIFLSGGLDSSTLVALMSRQTDAKLHTYSVGFEDDSFNELPYARIVAEHFKTEHREVIVTADMVRDLLPKSISFIDEPYGDGSAIPTYCVSELAKDEVVVVLSGEGGDEVFAGYDTYAAYKTYRMARRVPGAIRNRIIAPLAQLLPVSDKKLSFEFKLKRFLGGLDLPPEEAHLWWRIVLTEAQKFAMYSDRVRSELAAEPTVRHFRDRFARCGADDVLSRLMYIDSTLFLPDDLMIKNDRMTMAHSLEARVPFTDPELTGYLGRVPPALKMKAGRKKHLMRRAMEGHLPQEILDKKKVGLEMPYSRWLKTDLADMVHHYLGAERMRKVDIFRPDAVTRLVDEHMASKRDHGRALWGMLNLSMWHEMYIE